MKREKIQEFTLRITQAKRSELVVVLYDMVLAYFAEAEEFYHLGKKEEFLEELKKAQACIKELTGILDFKYEISFELLSLYRYVNFTLSKTMIRRDPELLKDTQGVIEKLREAFYDISAQDQSEPMMANTEAVYAGLTYGKGTLNENLQNQGSSRGFLA